jgi:16S rRNA (guanine(966)-N(2))-methyltransferase RsmD
MRIISGHLGSRRLKSPPETIYLRPTTDMVRESLFNILSNRISFSGITAADLFCGTGSFGFECISRGAESCVFVDKNTGYALSNGEMLGVKDKCIFIKSDAIKFLSDEPENKFNIIFADPPYIYEKYEKLIDAASKHDTVFVLEHKSGERFTSHRENILLQKKHGITEITIFDFRKNKTDEK